MAGVVPVRRGDHPKAAAQHGHAGDGADPARGLQRWAEVPGWAGVTNGWRGAQEFLQQYRIIVGAPQLPPPSTQLCKQLSVDFVSRHTVVDQQNIQFGTSKIFMPELQLPNDENIQYQYLPILITCGNIFPIFSLFVRILNNILHCAYTRII